jgi:hypothetical protein
LKETSILLDVDVPTVAIDIVVPEAVYRLTLSHTDDDSPDIDDKLDNNDRPQEYPT